MNKNIIPAVVSGDETKTFTDIEPLHMTCDFLRWSLSCRKNRALYNMHFTDEGYQLETLTFYWYISAVIYKQMRTDLI